MKRQIKFRGQLSHSKQWVYGNLIIAKNGQPYIIPSELFEPDGHHLIINSDEPFWVIPETVGQFTGLLDKNKTEIYEGDIVKSLIGKKDVVIFKLGCFCWDNQPLTFDRQDFKIYETEDWAEVIGNIYENPELIPS